VKFGRRQALVAYYKECLLSAQKEQDWRVGLPASARSERVRIKYFVSKWKNELQETGQKPLEKAPWYVAIK